MNRSIVGRGYDQATRSTDGRGYDRRTRSIDGRGCDQETLSTGGGLHCRSNTLTWHKRVVLLGFQPNLLFMSFTDWSFLYSAIQTKQTKQQQRKNIKICQKNTQVSRLVFYAQSTIMGENEINKKQQQ